MKNPNKQQLGIIRSNAIKAVNHGNFFKKLQMVTSFEISANKPNQDV
jgi:hypothetical protein